MVWMVTVWYEWVWYMKLDMTVNMKVNIKIWKSMKYPYEVWKYESMKVSLWSMNEESLKKFLSIPIS